MPYLLKFHFLKLFSPRIYFNHRIRITAKRADSNKLIICISVVKVLFIFDGTYLGA